MSTRRTYGRQPYTPAAFTYQDIFGCVEPRAKVRPEGLIQLKKTPVTPTKIEHATFRFVARWSPSIQIAIKKHWRYTACPWRNVPDFGRVFLMLKYTDITQNTYVQS